MLFFQECSTILMGLDDLDVIFSKNFGGLGVFSNHFEGFLDGF